MANISDSNLSSLNSNLPSGQNDKTDQQSIQNSPPFNASLQFSNEASPPKNIFRATQAIINSQLSANDSWPSDNAEDCEKRKHQSLITESQALQISQSQKSPTSIVRTNSNRSNIQCTPPSNRINTRGSTIQITPPSNRSNVIIQNLSSASLKKRKKKLTHCRFCPRNILKKDFHEHLKKNDTCAQLYQRELRVNCVDAVLIKCFKCLGCSQVGNFRLKRHLDLHHRCFNIYKDKFQIQTTDELTQRLRNLNRQSAPSRQSSERHQAYQRNVNHDTITDSQATNNFKRNIALANYRMCCKCMGHFLEGSAVELKQDDELYKELDLDQKPEFRRMNKYFCCKVCSSSNINIDTNFSKPILKTFNSNGVTILYPSNSDSEIIADSEFNSKTLILIPKNVNFNKKVQKLHVNPYKCHDGTNRFFSTIYNNQLFKYLQKKSVIDRYEGKIENFNQRKLSSVKPIIDDSDIRLSDTWTNSRISGLQARFAQFGQAALALNVELELNTPETISTSLLIQNSVVTLEFEGNQSFDMTTKYYLHRHKSNINCGTSCVKDLIRPRNFQLTPLLPVKFIPVFLSSIHQKMNGLVTHFLRNSTCDITAKEYYVGVKFTPTGTACIEALIWTETCDKFNEKASECSLTNGHIDAKEYLTHISKTVMTTSSVSELKHLLNITETEAEDLSNSVKNFQVESNNQPVETLKLPSLECMLTVTPSSDYMSNLLASEKLLIFLRQKLHTTSIEDKIKLTTLEWLNRMETFIDMDIDDQYITLDLDDEIIEFKKDNRLAELMTEFTEFKGIYQYALTCSRTNDTVILKRISLIESYTTPYNPLILKAFNQRMEITPVNSYNQWDLFQQKYEKPSPQLENSDLSGLLSNHRLISIVEFIGLCDPLKIRDIQSSSTEFVSTYMTIKPKFKKTKFRDDKIFNDEEGEMYLPLSSCLLRHNSRINGKNLLLVETVLNYEVLTKKESKETFEIYKENKDKIPVSEIKSVYGTENMPKYILCGEESVLRIRSKMKVLEVPHFPKDTLEFKYSMTLLYFPLAPNTKIDVERIDDYYYATNPNNDKDFNGKLLTIIQSNER